MLVVARLSRGMCDDVSMSFISFITGVDDGGGAGGPPAALQLTSSVCFSFSSILSLAIFRITLVGVNAGFNVAWNKPHRCVHHHRSL